LSKLEQWVVFEFLYAKKDKSNLDPDELKAFRLLALAYARLNTLQLKAMMGNRALMEICREETTDLQK